jgi:hypothetical protein
LRQALHIFKKDARYLRKELCLIAALALLYVWAASHPVNPAWAGLLLAIGAAYVIARLIQAESIPGDKQFWLTRPYCRSSLLIAKILGIILFVNAPIFAARLYLLVASGFPLQSTLGALLWSHFLLLVGAMLPIAALASVTPGIVPFTFAGLILVAIGFGIDSSIAPPRPLAVRLNLSSSQWIWDSIAVLTLIAVAIPVLYIQYRSRRTWISRSVILCVLVVGAAGYMYIPWPVAAAIQSSLSRQRFDSRAVHVSLAPEAKQFFSRGVQGRNDFQIDVPIAVRGIPDDVEVVPDGLSLIFQAADGSTWSSGNYIYPALAKVAPGPGAPILNANVDVPGEFFERAKDQRVKAKGTLYLTIFGNSQARTIPIQSRPVNVQDGMQCRLGVFEQLSCWSAFRWPARLVYAKFGNGGAVPFTGWSVSYSPFPAGMVSDAVESRQVSVRRGAHEVTILTKEPLAFLRRDFEIDNFPLVTLGHRVIGSRRRE